MKKEMFDDIYAEIGDKIFDYLNIEEKVDSHFKGSFIFDENISKENIYKYRKQLSNCSRTGSCRFDFASCKKIDKEMAMKFLDESSYLISLHSWVGSRKNDLSEDDIIEVFSHYKDDDGNEDCHISDMYRWDNINISDKFFRTYRKYFKDSELVKSKLISKEFREELIKNIADGKKGKVFIYNLFTDSIKEKVNHIWGKHTDYIKGLEFSKIKEHGWNFDFDEFTIYIEEDFGLIMKYDKETNMFTNLITIYEPHTAEKIHDDEIMIEGHEQIILLNPMTFDSKETYTR